MAVKRRKKRTRKQKLFGETFHIVLLGERTTFSLDRYLADLLAIHLGMTPQTREAHTALRQYLVDQLHNQQSIKILGVSLMARRAAIKAITKPAVLQKYGHWLITSHESG